MTRFFRACYGLVLLASVILAGSANSAGAECRDPGGNLGVSRIVEIDTSAGPIFGSMTRQVREPSFLRSMEVVLTFDDGPMPFVTKSILDTLDTFCTKATFFSVGRMALSYPSTVKDILARGHTLGSHTYTHPFNMPRMKTEAAQLEIEHGLAAVTTAAGTPIAPFFRFTGLSDSSRLLGYLQTRRIATFTVDVVSNDSYIHDPAELAARTMAEVRHLHGGIILFHDIKTTTAKALPLILARLKTEGYSVVHVRAKAAAQPLASAMRDVAPKLAHVDHGPAGHSDQVSQTSTTSGSLEVASVVPPVRNRAIPLARAADAEAGKDAGGATAWMKSSLHELTGPPVFVDGGDAVPASNGWVTAVKPKFDVRGRKAP